MRVKDTVAKAMAGLITWKEVEHVLCCSARHVRRLRANCVLEGLESLRDKRAGRSMPRRIPDETIREIMHLREVRYFDFNIKHFHEKLQKRHKIKVSYTYVKRLLQMTGLAEKAPAKGKHRRKRERRPMRGMMMFMDGSPYAWLGAAHGNRDLVSVLDDADGRVLYGQFWPEENTKSCLIALQEVLEKHGLFSEFYVDRGSHFVYTPKAGGPVERGHTQIERVLQGLRIQLIASYSPQGRGRIERSYRTQQGRLPQELREAGITDWDAANRYLREEFWPSYNETFTVEPASPESAFVPLVGVDIRRACALEHTVTVYPDNCVRWRSRSWQIPAHPSRPSFARCKAILVEYLDGCVDIEYGRLTVAQFDHEGQPSGRQAARRVS